ncbi:MAG: DNA primase large subunit PriL [Candidatus Nezhaarchaeota archaeon]|nr:DNA primase large subunit PriL [Candidatus Nezhaarchaeota archaeon]
MLTREDMAKYPFTPEAQDFVKERGLTVDQLNEPEYGSILRRAVDRIKEALISGVVSAKLSEVEVEVLSYPAAVMLATLSSDKLLQNKYAEGEAKRAYFLLKAEHGDKLAYIASRCFNWRVKKVFVTMGSRSYDFLIAWDDYLSVSMSFKSMHWKLVNRTLSAGLIYLQKHELSRLLSEALRQRLLRRMLTTAAISLQLTDRVGEALKEILEIGKLRAPRVTTSLEEPLSGSEESYPPCIKSLISDALAGKSLPHTARFTLASFLISLGKSVDEVVDIFRNLPDFDEKRTLYHVRHIAGEAGSKTRYSPPSCESLRTFNLCSSPDDICGHIKHPLAYLRLRALKQRSVK